MEVFNVSAQEEPQEERWVIKNEAEANWCFYKIEQAQAKIAQAQKTVAEAKEFAAKVKAQESEAIDRFKGYLLEWADQQEDDDWSFVGPAGKISFDKERQTMTKGDEAKLINQFANTDYVKKLVKLDWGELKKTLTIANGKVITADGEVVEGVKINTKAAGWKIKNKPEGAHGWHEV
ncbi:host-nuclease inhibitor Gam family protein [Limosilactobacillus ingluviei]|uniref:host-nuclease inhibitor Gam family protein n=1 Tax=Limosilactobacillus ingluviei TaxID=148604 RepID=UPI00265DC946|nr:host-nuclease inhibitor Gam family protein [Limosilactobacillus ingluviei]